MPWRKVMKATQLPELDYLAVAQDLVHHLQDRWPQASPAQRQEALLLALYALDGPTAASVFLAAQRPTASCRCRCNG